MSDRDAESVIREASASIRREGSFANFVQNSVIGGIVLAFTLAVVDVILAAGQTIMAPIRAIASGLESLLQSIIGEPTLIIEAGVANAVSSLTHGTAALLGPFTFPLAVFVVMLGLYVFGEMWKRMEISPLGWMRSLRR